MYISGRAKTSAVSVILCASILSACDSERLVSPTRPPDPSKSVSQLDRADSSSVQLLTRGIALALALPEVRQQILEDLRDSPFDKHTIELGSYLRGPRGRALAQAAASQLHVPLGTVIGAVGTASAQGLVFGMPRYGDRRNWTGTENVAVVGTTRAPNEILSRASYVSGFDTRGHPTEIYLRGPGPIPYFAISPAPRPFGTDAEEVRARAPKRSGRSIGAVDEVVGVFMVPCDVDCGSGGGGGGGSTLGPGYVVLPSAQTYAQCVNNILYLEAVKATCRAELAAAFRPRSIFNSDEPCKDREPFWTVYPGPAGNEIDIFYAMSYWVDCGNRTGTADSHPGDSEFIIVRVFSDPSSPAHWYLANVTLSAHYGFGFFGDDTWTGSPPAIEFRPYENLTRPKVYIAWGKHGNYRDVGSCGRGGYGADDCGRAVDTGEELGLLSGNASDLGFRLAPMRDCVQSRLYLLRNGIECYWSYSYFHTFAGWNGGPEGATAYTGLLRDFGF
jgi:hypothetical protein